MLPKVRDRKGRLQSRQWVYDHYGFVHVIPPAGKPAYGPRYCVEVLQEMRGPVLTVAVLASNADPIAQVRVMLSWPDAPNASGAGWLERAIGAKTDRGGMAHHALGKGAHYQPPTIGPHAVWIHGPNTSPMVTGLGIVDDHILAPTFRLLDPHEPITTPPVDEALRFLHSASKHMGTAINDVSAAIDRLQCLPPPEPIQEASP